LKVISAHPSASLEWLFAQASGQRAGTGRKGAESAKLCAWQMSVIT